MSGALVTGASGFIGSHLVRRLARDGGIVHALAHTTPLAAPAGVRAFGADLRDAAVTADAVMAARPEVIYHLAAQASVIASMRDPEADIRTNVLGAVHLARAAVGAGVRRVVYVSSGGALYGDPAAVPLTEETPAEPQSVYGVSKLTAEHMLRVLLAGSAVTLSVVRPGSVYGPGQRAGGESGVVAIFIERMLRDEPVTIFGDGSQQRDYIYVADVVEAVVRAAAGPPATCLAGTGAGTSTRALFALLAGLTGYRRAPVHAPVRAGEVQRVVLDSTRARTLWEWAPRVPLAEGLARTVAAFRSGPA